MYYIVNIISSGVFKVVRGTAATEYISEIYITNNYCSVGPFVQQKKIISPDILTFKV